MSSKRAFTLIELLVVIGIIAVLAALVFPALSHAKEQSRISTCISNARQINLAIRLYADDSADSLPVLPEPNPYPNGVGAFYKQLVKGYVGLGGPASPNERVFCCPSDFLIRTQLTHAFTSYTFNGYEVSPDSLPRITGKKLSAIQAASKAVLVGEYPAFWGGSWHPYSKAASLKCAAIFGFVDSHASFSKVFWDRVPGSHPSNYEPPPFYDYNWDGE